MANYIIRTREQVFVNTDPQRRCYNGCFFSGEWQWTAWKILESGIPENHIEDRLKFWRELTDYAVSQRDEHSRCEFERVVQEE